MAGETVRRLIRLHLRWFGLFGFVAALATGFSHLQAGNIQVFQTAAFYLGLLPTVAVCALLALLVPWGVYAIDPQRTATLSTDGLLRYWKVP